VSRLSVTFKTTGLAFVRDEALCRAFEAEIQSKRRPAERLRAIACRTGAGPWQLEAVTPKS
jgi:hypothetical protein